MVALVLMYLIADVLLQVSGICRVVASGIGVRVCAGLGTSSRLRVVPVHGDETPLRRVAQQMPAIADATPPMINRRRRRAEPSVR